jgi:hypothetical protein
MPTTPNFSIDYPCEGSSITLSDFSMLALDTETALAAANTTATFATHRPYVMGSWASANPTVAVETTAVFSANTSSSGITVNAAAGTATIVTPGIYMMGVTTSSGAQSSLTMTSQRASIFKNAAFFATKRYRGSNPTSISCNGGSFTLALSLAAGDVITVSYLWTGTGSLAAAGGSSGNFSLTYLMNA